jgi:hypothetical protein
MTRAVHWMGGVEWVDARGALHVRLSHWPACCSGARAEQLAEQLGACSYEINDVTCARCRAMLARDRRAGGERE